MFSMSCFVLVAIDRSLGNINFYNANTRRDTKVACSQYTCISMTQRIVRTRSFCRQSCQYRSPPNDIAPQIFPRNLRSKRTHGPGGTRFKARRKQYRVNSRSLKNRSHSFLIPYLRLAILSTFNTHFTMLAQRVPHYREGGTFDVETTR